MTLKLELCAIMLNRLSLSIIRKGKKLLRTSKANLSIKYISGPQKFQLSNSDVLVISPIINAIYWLPCYLEHYRKLGVAGFVLVDTGSTDRTLEYLSQQNDVILFSCPTYDYQNEIRMISAKRFARNAWALFADVDEILDPPRGLSLPELAENLTRRNFTCLPALMLDMFPEGPVLTGCDFSNALQSFLWFDADWINFRPYLDPGIKFHKLLATNNIGSKNLRIAYGGIRKKIFGENPCLTKHPLVRIVDGVKAGFHPHCSIGTSIADFHGVLRHYKFTNRPDLRDRESVNSGIRKTGEDKARLSVFESQDNVVMWSKYSVPYSGVSQLSDLGLILPMQ